MGERKQIQLERDVNQLLEKEKKAAIEETKKEQLEIQKQKMQKGMEKLRDRMLLFAEQYGVEDFRTQLMIQLNEISMIMQEQVQLIDSVTVAFDYIFTTINFFDEAFQLQTDLLSGSLKQKYGFFAKFKEKMRIRKVMKNLRNRMDMISMRISSISDISQNIVDSIRTATTKMVAKMEKDKNKRAKKGQVDVKTEDSKSLQMIREYLASKNSGNAGAGANAGASAGAGTNAGANAGAGTSSSSSPDDIDLSGTGL